MLQIGRGLVIMSLAPLAACADRTPGTASTGGESSTGSPGSTSATLPTSSDTSSTATPSTSAGPSSTATTSSASTDSDTASTDSDTASTSVTATTGSDTASTGGVEQTTGTGGESTGGSTGADDPGELGEPCLVNSDCASRACLEFRDHDPKAVCVAAPPGGNTRLPGTLLTFPAGAPLPATDVKFVGLLAALLEGMNAKAVVMGSSDGAGLVDVTSAMPLQEGIGVTAMLGGGPIFTSCTGVASPMQGMYGPMSDRHDLWGVPSATVTQWSGFLMKEPALAANLPLGAQGGTLGLVRDSTGQPIAGAKLQSQNGNSKAQIRYLSENKQGFNPDQTASSGVFVVLGPALAERFELVGAPEVSAAANSAKQAVFVMVLDLP
jgi:hypothetical protein